MNPINARDSARIADLELRIRRLERQVRHIPSRFGKNRPTSLPLSVRGDAVVITNFGGASYSTITLVSLPLKVDQRLALHYSMYLHASSANDVHTHIHGWLWLWQDTADAIKTENHGARMTHVVLTSGDPVDRGEVESDILTTSTAAAASSTHEVVVGDWNMFSAPSIELLLQFTTDADKRISGLAATVRRDGGSDGTDIAVVSCLDPVLL